MRRSPIVLWGIFRLLLNVESTSISYGAKVTPNGLRPESKDGIPDIGDGGSRL
jgi:hypothetical protein